MNMNKLTQKSQEALRAAQSIAVERGHQGVDTEHLLLALVDQDDGLVSRLLTRMNVTTETLRAKVTDDLDHRPRVSGSGADTDGGYLTARLVKVFGNAEKQAKKMKDDYVSVEHLLAALVDDAGDTPAGRYLSGIRSDSRSSPRLVARNP